MLAHNLRRVQKSQVLSRGLSSREELDVLMLNVHAVVDGFIEEGVHGIKLEGEWTRSEIIGRVVYLIIMERHKKDGTWKSMALSDPSLSTVLADMTRPRATREGPAEDLSRQRVLPTALAELPAPSRAAATQRLASPARDAPGEESDGHVSASVDGTKMYPKMKFLARARLRQTGLSSWSGAVPNVAQAPRHPNYRRTPTLSNLIKPGPLHLQLPSPGSSALSSIIGGLSQAPVTEPTVGFPQLEPVSRNPIDLTHTNEDEPPSFPTLNCVPVPARPTPARPRGQGWEYEPRQRQRILQQRLLWAGPHASQYQSCSPAIFSVNDRCLGSPIISDLVNDDTDVDTLKEQFEESRGEIEDTLDTWSLTVENDLVSLLNSSTARDGEETEAETPGLDLQLALPPKYHAFFELPCACHQLPRADSVFHIVDNNPCPPPLYYPELFPSFQSGDRHYFKPDLDLISNGPLRLGYVWDVDEVACYAKGVVAAKALLN
ncbi:hypothetical protein FS749_008472 [Ceratobasidium sp. UAMH 11750]|nr:hypothetical protein FS749_008472 [Ceratobasidium sp. UAMH 11750]